MKQGLKKILQHNKEWSQHMIKDEPDYFKKLVDIQKPKYLWIGCSDSRVPAN
jgi:carbonic anhydrase